MLPEAIEACLNNLTSQDANTAYWAYLSLMPHWLNDPTVITHCRYTLESSHIAARVMAARVLLDADLPGNKEILIALIRLAATADEDVVESIISVANRHQEKINFALFECFTAHEQTSELLQATYLQIMQFCEKLSPQDASVVLNFLHSPRANIVHLALGVFNENVSAQPYISTQLILPLLEHDDPAVRSLAVQVIVQIEGNLSVTLAAVVEQALRRNKAIPAYLVQASYYLSHIGNHARDDREFDLLLQSNDENIRYEALSIFCRLTPNEKLFKPVVIKALLRNLQSANIDIKLQAALWLCGIGGYSKGFYLPALQVVQEMLRHETLYERTDLLVFAFKHNPRINYLSQILLPAVLERWQKEEHYKNHQLITKFISEFTGEPPHFMTKLNMFHPMVAQLPTPILGPNPGYLYADNYFSSALEAMVKNLQQQHAFKTQISIYPIISSLITDWHVYLRMEQSLQSDANRFALFPYNPGGHWTIIMLEITPSHECVRAQFFDSLVREVAPVQKMELMKYIIQQYFPRVEMHMFRGYVQYDAVSCGPFAVENVRLALMRLMPDLALTPADARMRQLSEMKDYLNPFEFEEMYLNQAANASQFIEDPSKQLQRYHHAALKSEAVSKEELLACLKKGEVLAPNIHQQLSLIIYNSQREGVEIAKALRIVFSELIHPKQSFEINAWLKELASFILKLDQTREYTSDEILETSFHEVIDILNEIARPPRAEFPISAIHPKNLTVFIAYFVNLLRSLDFVNSKQLRDIFAVGISETGSFNSIIEAINDIQAYNLKTAKPIYLIKCYQQLLALLQEADLFASEDDTCELVRVFNSEAHSKLTSELNIFKVKYAELMTRFLNPWIKKCLRYKTINVFSTIFDLFQNQELLQEWPGLQDIYNSLLDKGDVRLSAEAFMQVVKEDQANLDSVLNLPLVVQLLKCYRFEAEVTDFERQVRKLLWLVQQHCPEVYQKLDDFFTEYAGEFQLSLESEKKFSKIIQEVDLCVSQSTLSEVIKKQICSLITVVQKHKNHEVCGYLWLAKITLPKLFKSYSAEVNAGAQPSNASPAFFQRNAKDTSSAIKRSAEQAELEDLQLRGKSARY